MPIMLNEICDKLKERGYVAYIKKVNKALEFLIAGVGDKETGLKADASFNVFIEDGYFKAEYRKGQLPVDKQFKTIEELVAFAEKQFPL